jgi:CO/xanthine dehydrogenase Mo-binding subunit
MKMNVIDDLGAFSEWLAIGMLLKPLLCLGSCYHIVNVQYTCKGVVTNKTPQGPLRAFGLPPHFWVLEQLLDIAAKELELERNEIRRRNFIKQDQFPYVSPSGNIYDSGDYEASLRLLTERAGYEELLSEQRAARSQGRLIGLSVVSSIEPGLTGPPMLALASPRIFNRTSSPEGILLRIDGFGKLIAELGFPPGGQSQHSFVRQILADYFAVKLDDVQVITVDSLSMQPSTGPISSSMAIALSGAVLGAAGRLADKLKQVAAVMLEARPDDIEFLDGEFRVRGVPEKALAVGQVSQFMMARPDLLPSGIDANPQATYVWNPPDRTIPDQRGFGRYSVTAAGAQHLCMVEVDRGTGQVKILKYVMVDDCGVRLNPSVVRGMLMGGMAHGVGTALLEEYVYDSAGQMLTSSYMDYLMPTIMEVPPAEEHAMCTPSPIAPLGVKGVGEGALHTTPAAVLCAVNDALDPLGVRITEAPMSTLRVWQALQRAPR